jgi:hypothetical protein
VNLEENIKIMQGTPDTFIARKEGNVGTKGTK